MNLKEAKEKFVELLNGVDPLKKTAFLRYVTTYSDVKRTPLAIDAEQMLRTIASSLREQIPTTAVLASEKIRYPKDGFDSEHTEQNTAHIDCFLYDDEAVENLVSQGKMSRNYCLECGSKNTKPLLFISHSLSIPQIEFMFTQLVPLNSPSLTTDFHVLDIGSRLGAVIFGASLFSNGRVKVTGIEMNEELCALQRKIVDTKELGLSNVSVVCADVRTQTELLASASLVTMNNVFSFFLSPQEQANSWELVHSHLQPGTLLVHNPSIHDITAHLNLSFNIDNWLEEEETLSKCADFAGADEDLFEDCSSLHLYRVKAK